MDRDLRSELRELRREEQRTAMHLRGGLRFLDGVSVPNMAKDVVRSLQHERFTSQELRVRAEKAEARALFELESREVAARTVVSIIGGHVEGAPTLTINYLQRLRALVEIEAERDRLRDMINAAIVAADTALSPLRVRHHDNEPQCVDCANGCTPIGGDCDNGHLSAPA